MIFTLENNLEDVIPHNYQFGSIRETVRHSNLNNRFSTTQLQNAHDYRKQKKLPRETNMESDEFIRKALELQVCRRRAKQADRIEEKHNAATVGKRFVHLNYVPRSQLDLDVPRISRL